MISSGILYTALSKYSNVIISLIVTAILARLLSPDEFGVVAIVLVFVTFFYLISDFGIGPAIIQNKELNNEDIRSIFSFTILLGLFLTVIFFLSGGVIADFYKTPALLNVTRLLSFSILFFSINIVPTALLLKQLNFKKIGLYSTLVQLMTGGIAVVLAYQGFSYYALVIKSILDSFLLLLIFYSINPVGVTLQLKKASLLKIANFSTYQFLFNFVNYFSRNADNLLIGKYLGTSPLGYYDRAYKLMLLPAQNLTHVVTPVLLPVLSKHQDNPSEILRQYYTVIRILAIIGFPLSAFLFFSASEIVQVVYGKGWEQSVAIFKLLSITVGAQIVLSSSGAIFQAINKTKLLFVSGLLSSFFMVAGITYGVFVIKTLEGIAYGLIVAFLINFLQGFYVLISCGFKSSFSEFLIQFLHPLLLTFILVNILCLVTDFSISNIYLMLLVKASVFLIVSVIYIVLRKEYREYVTALFAKM